MKGINCSISLANQFDAFAIASINALAWKKAYSKIISNELLDAISVSEWTGKWESALKLNAQVLKLSVSKNIVGFSQISKSDLLKASKIGEINSLYIHPDWCGRGLGSKLCSAALALLKKKGFENAIIWVLSENLNARLFYKRLGLNASGESRVLSLLPNENLQEVQYSIDLSDINLSVAPP
jgi:ribosomal protein S18 acetylase RimI-like enzyme